MNRTLRSEVRHSVAQQVTGFQTLRVAAFILTSL